MLLNELVTDILYEGDVKDLHLKIYLKEGRLKTSIQNSAGGFIKGVGKALSAHPFLTGVMAGFAVDALKKYNRNKRNTINFYGKSFREKNFYKQMIKDLEKSGHYKVIRNQFVDGGQLWQLKRTGSRI